MNKVYIIEIDESSAYEKDTSICKEAFTSYDKAKEFLLNSFDCHGDREYGSDFFH